MGRPSNTEVRREEIVDALLRVMAREGYARASVARVAAAAGLSQGLVHYHFDSKLEVLLAAVGELTRSVQARYQALAAKAGDEPLRQLNAMTDAYLALGRDADPAAVGAWAVVGAEAVRSPEVRAVYRKTLSRARDDLTRLVRASLVAHRRPTWRARRIAAVLLAAIEGAFRISAGAPGTLPRGFAAPMVRQLSESLILAR